MDRICVIRPNAKYVYSIRFVLFVMVSIISLVVSSSATADGGFVGPEQMDLREPGQLGLIVWDGNREDLYLKVRFEEAEYESV